jgi:hypothetical protein
VRRDIDPSVRRAVSRSAILVSRLVLLLVAAGALAAGIVITIRDRPGAVPAAIYTCPMHAEVRAGRPGECPICGMALGRTGSAPTSRRDLPGAADIAASARALVGR